MPVKLNIGAGDVDAPGFIAIDRKLGLEAYPLPEHVNGTKLETDSVDEVRASHVLEHFSFAVHVECVRRTAKNQPRVRHCVWL